MKRFSNLTQIEKIEKTKKPIIEKSIEKILKETLTVNIKGEEFVGKNITISGQENFISEMENLIEESKLNLITESFNMFDQVLLNTTLEKLYEMYDAISLVPNPEDIFSSEDYEIKNDTMILTSLENMPEDFLNFVNKDLAGHYFDVGNTIRITYTDDNTWRLFFIPQLAEYNNDYLFFIKDNKEFISDFIKSVQNLIGSKNLILDRKLLSSI